MQEQNIILFPVLEQNIIPLIIARTEHELRHLLPLPHARTEHKFLFPVLEQNIIPLIIAKQNMKYVIFFSFPMLEQYRNYVIFFLFPMQEQNIIPLSRARTEHLLPIPMQEQNITPLPHARTEHELRHLLPLPMPSSTSRRHIFFKKMTYSAIKRSSRSSEDVARLSGSGSKQRRMKLIAFSDSSCKTMTGNDLQHLGNVRSCR
jgi:hypothetical protein